MRVGRAGTIAELDADAWARLAADAGITLPFLRRRATALILRIESACVTDAVQKGLAERTGLRAGAIRQTLER